MSNLVPQGFGSVPTVFRTSVDSGDEFSSGIQSSLAILSYRGSKWRIKYRGEERLLLREDGEPRASIELVLVAASNHLSKIFYRDGYKEGSTEAPDCFSNNGVTPDPSARAKQANACAACAMNAWGSRITPAGKAGKACSDSKRVVAVPLMDIENELFGGPMLLRVPAASLNDLATYAQRMKQTGYPLYAIGTRITFDPAANYPKMLFKEIRALTEEEATLVNDLRFDTRTQRILSDNLPEDTAASAAPQPQFEQAAPAAYKPQPMVAAPVAAVPMQAPEAEPAPAKRTYKKRTAATEAEPAPAPAPVPAAELLSAFITTPVSSSGAEDDDGEEGYDDAAPTGTSVDDELTAQLNSLLPRK